jgi:hypothetical protein
MQISHSKLFSHAYSHYHFSQKERIAAQTTIAQSSKQLVKSIQKFSERDKELMSMNPKYLQMFLALEALMGKKISIVSFKEIPTPSSNTIINQPTVIYEQMQEEASSLDLSLSGNLETEDGKLVNFALSIHWNEKFTAYKNETLQSTDFSDPLIITLDGNQPVLKEKFDFDFTKDSKALNYLSNQSGYLALDKNGDNLINGGEELFGPQSGDGFVELREYDEDNNGWIDENDSVYTNLKFWKISQDKNELISLDEIGIGAISLQGVSIDFMAKADINTPIAHYKEASVALGKSGNPYGVFSVDLAV